MSHARRHARRGAEPHGDGGRRGRALSLAVLPAAVCTVLASGLIGSFAYGLAPARAEGPVAPRTASRTDPSPTAGPEPSPSATHGPEASPTPSRSAPPNPPRSPRARPEPRPAERPAERPVGHRVAEAPSVQSTRPAITPDTKVAPLDRVPVGGSRPQAGSDQGAGVAGANRAAIDADRPSGWEFLPDPDVGRRIFLAGMIALLLSIGGLVAVAIRRRQW